MLAAEVIEGCCALLESEFVKSLSLLTEVNGEDLKLFSAGLLRGMLSSASRWSSGTFSFSLST